ncbi:MAG TPA: 50S ribosomal protein L10 [Glycomyces sp.]|nr:50S ribosomal protein L10 [Glycomyces sp.]
MPNIVNEMLYEELEREFRAAGSCLVLAFDKLTVKQDEALRNELRSHGVRYRVVKNRLALRAAKAAYDVEMGPAFKGKCGVVFAPEEKAISAARIVRDAMKAHRRGEPPVRVVGAIIEGEAITGAAAVTVADMPDRNTVNAQLATALSGPARQLATVLAAVPAGLARCIQAKIDKEQG